MFKDISDCFNKYYQWLPTNKTKPLKIKTCVQFKSITWYMSYQTWTMNMLLSLRLRHAVVRLFLWAILLNRKVRHINLSNPICKYDITYINVFMYNIIIHVYEYILISEWHSPQKQYWLQKFWILNLKSQLLSSSLAWGKKWSES